MQANYKVVSCKTQEEGGKDSCLYNRAHSSTYII
jgi:hypothetical protein